MHSQNTMDENITMIGGPEEFAKRRGLVLMPYANFSEFTRNHEGSINPLEYDIEEPSMYAINGQLCSYLFHMRVFGEQKYPEITIERVHDLIEGVRRATGQSLMLEISPYGSWVGPEKHSMIVIYKPEFVKSGVSGGESVGWE